ncbi:hypothetical protein [Microbacterium capsulatum]|uniref:Uncharacterized protein n=1 Tax=Microbacterium capsulatum TaxID=3041921 RepID=A0ABU0XBJ1_9MICO|nr:hypothetical protein [Microbacterium sp. ASV81]MDQ4212476.1 hypothetical protein [Microbacterium sp. ASV81]
MKNRFRRGLLAIGVPGLAVLLASLSVSFLGSTGTATPTVTSGSTSSNFVYPISTSTSPLPSGVTFGKYTTSTTTGSTTTLSVVSPSWTPIAQSATTVTTAGDLAIIDASTANLGTHTGLTVSLYVTNLASLQKDYSSYSLPVNVYQCQTACTSNAAWTQATGVSVSYLTSTSGYLTWNLPANYYYAITVDTGGSLYNTATTPANLSPAYYFTAQPI